MSQIEFDFTTHQHENNPVSQAHLEENKKRFSKQCKLVYGLLMEGKEVTRRGAMVEHGILDVVRRLHDLMDAGVQISDRWENGSKVWYCSLADRTTNLLNINRL